MDYKEKYEAALERAREWYNKTEPDSYTCIVESIFPELKESKEEWIEKLRKEIITFLGNKKVSSINESDAINVWIAWLEKQKEIDKSSYEIAEKEKYDFVSGQFIECRKSFNEFKEDNSYWFEYVGNDTYIGRSDNILNKKFYITPRQLFTLFTQQHCPKENNINEETNAPIGYGKYVDECLNEASKHFFSEGEDKYSVADLFYAGVRCGKSWIKKQSEPKNKINSCKITFEDVLALECSMETAKITKGGDELYKILVPLYNKIHNAYLDEKQREQKPVNDTDEEVVKAVSNTSVLDMVEPKFKVGDIVQYITDSTDRRKIEEVDTLCNMYHTDSSPIMFEIEDEWKIVVNAEDVEQKPSDTVESNFKVGDWVVWDNKISCHIDNIYQGKESLMYAITDAHNMIRSYSVKGFDDNAHLWTIQDAKDGDVLAEDSCIFIIQKLVSNGTSAKTYFTLYDDGDFDDGTILYFDINSTKPATKEQRNILFQKMHKAGYEWSAEMKELMKIEDIYMYSTDNYTDKEREILCEGCEVSCKYNLTDWSEEDEKQLNDIIELLPNLSNRHNWLKSLKDRVQPQPKQQWSEEDKRIASALSQLLKDCESENGWNCVYSNDREVFFVDIEMWLQSLKDRLSIHQNNIGGDDEIHYRILQGIICNSDVSSTLANRLLGWLQSIKQKKTWKPTGEQIEALESAMDNCAYNEYQDCLRELIEQLKKL